MIEVHYCIPSNFGTGAYATGSSRFESPAALQAWLVALRDSPRAPSTLAGPLARGVAAPDEMGGQRA